MKKRRETDNERATGKAPTLTWFSKNNERLKEDEDTKERRRRKEKIP